MTTTRVRIAVGFAIAATAACLLLSGCTPNQGPQHSATPTAAINGLPAGVRPAAIPSDVPNTAEARKQTQLSSCEGSDREWTAAGTIKNGTDKAKDYRITVFFTTPSATVIDSAQTTVSVDAGASKKWSTAKTFATGGKLLCVLRGVG